jgi:hypothetical protein
MIPQTAVRVKGGFVMEPGKIEKPMVAQREGQSSPSRQPERKRRFQIVRLEERIAPGGGEQSKGTVCHGACGGTGAGCHR